jgi:hypothetical protein
MNKKDVLEDVSFGERVAEDERKRLVDYFVRTREAQSVIDGLVDIVYGPKGAGKSALYGHLVQDGAAFEQRGILVIPCEQPLGETVFRDLVNQLPQPSEQDLRYLWPLYFAQLIAHEFRKHSYSDSDARYVTRNLEDAKLLPREFSLRGLLRTAFTYVKYVVTPESVEGGIEVDPYTGLPRGATVKITFEDSEAERSTPQVSVRSLLARAERALAAHRSTAWLLLDRLDVSFLDDPALEEVALRALFRVYLDLKQHDHIRLKIFLRSDIWERITRTKGFPEGSHITRQITIKWQRSYLVNLLCRRLVTSDRVCRLYQTTRSQVQASITKQEQLLTQIIEHPPGLPADADIVDWLLLGIRDGTKQAAPRELIHLMNEARMNQLALWNLEEGTDDSSHLISHRALLEAHREVSRTRLEQTLYTEYRHVKSLVTPLHGENPQQSLPSLQRLWDKPIEETQDSATLL